MLKLKYIMMIFIASWVAGCAMNAPRSFIAAEKPSFTQVEFRGDLSYEDAWIEVFYLVVQKFEIEKAYREEGYIRTEWLYTWLDERHQNYRVRLAIQFNPERKSLQFRSEAQIKSGGGWISGTDTRLVADVQSDILGTIGRTAR